MDSLNYYSAVHSVLLGDGTLKRIQKFWKRKNQQY